MSKSKSRISLGIAEHIFGDGLDPSENADCIRHPQVLRSLEEETASLESWQNIKKSFSYKLSKWVDVIPFPE